MTNQTQTSVPDCLIHDAVDSVAVVVVENIKRGQTLTGWVMDTDEHIEVDALDDIPLGHKVALTDLGENDPVIKYGFPIGRTTISIKRGEHIHIHNLKTEKW